MIRLLSWITVLLFPVSLAFGYAAAQLSKHTLVRAAQVMQTR